MQDLLTPLQRALADGCNLNRTTADALNRAGFSHVDMTQGRIPAAPSILANHIWGIATA
jgi:hypothetical protein